MHVALANASSCLSVTRTLPNTPASSFGKTTRQCFGAVPGAPARPAKYFGMKWRAAHGFVPLKAPRARSVSGIERRRATADKANYDTTMTM